MTDTLVEIEDKYDVADGFVVPPLDRVVPSSGRSDATSVRLHSEYFDTADGRLLAHRVTLRRREGHDDSGWQLKVPDGKARAEIRLPLEPGPTPGVPPQLSELVAGLTRGEPLQLQAVITTERTRHRVLGEDGSVLVEIDDDRVHATATGEQATARHWREIEVELGDGRRSLLGTLGRELREAGARPSPSASKLARALGYPTGPAAPGRGRRLVQEYVTEQVDAIVAGDIALRRGLDPIHATRVATRRLRSTLRAFGSLLDPDRSGALDGELRWWAGLLGDVRDPDVQLTRHRAAVHALPGELVLGPVVARLETELRHRRGEAEATLAEAQGGARYLDLLEELARWRAGLPFTAPAPRRDVRALAARTDRKADRLLRRATRRGADDATLHRARKAAKRARYVAELMRPVERSAVRRWKLVQDVLGDHQDGVVASELLRVIGAKAGVIEGENGFTFGILWQQEQDRAEASRAAARSLRC